MELLTDMKRSNPINLAWGDYCWNLDFAQVLDIVARYFSNQRI